jgi:single-strand DNA-binding protein
MGKFNINKFILGGTLGKDPEFKKTDTVNMCKMSVATSEAFKDSKGEFQDKTQWHSVIIWNEHLIAKAEREFQMGALVKGSEVYIEGTIQTRKWTDSAGVERFITEVVVPKFKGDFQVITSKKEAPESLTDGKLGVVLPNGRNDRQRVPIADFSALNDEIPF